jgi:hypothetical protein
MLVSRGGYGIIAVELNSIEGSHAVAARQRVAGEGGTHGGHEAAHG